MSWALQSAAAAAELQRSGAGALPSVQRRHLRDATLPCDDPRRPVPGGTSSLHHPPGTTEKESIVSGRLSINGAFAAPGRRALRSPAGSGRIEAAAPTGSTSGADPTVDQLVSEHLDYANAHYVKDGQPSQEAENMRLALE